MTPIRSNQRGTFVLKRRFRGVSPIRRATGTTQRRVFEAVDRMCSTLYEAGRLDLLEAVALGRIHPLVLLEKYRTNRLEQLPSAEVLPALLGTFAAWVAEADVSEETRRGRRGTLATLRRLTTDQATLADLATVLREYRARAGAHARAFNLTRTTLMAFARDVLGKRHTLYAAVRDVPPLKQRPRRKGRPLSAGELHRLVKAMGHPHGLMAWSMATTGMGPKEYFADGFTVEADRIVIHGEKREGRRDRLVPRVSLLIPPAVSLGRWKIRFRQHAPGRQPYDLRRTYANLMVEAQIPANRRGHYMGHGPKSMTELYEQPEVSRWLAEDAAALRAVLGEPEPMLRVIRA